LPALDHSAIADSISPASVVAYKVRMLPGGRILEIDELVHLVYKRGVYSDEYNIILKTGRSLPVGVITLTQEMGRIPANAFKQSNHRLGFYIDQASRYDRQIRDALLKAKVDDPKHPYGVYYQQQNGRGDPEYFASIQKFLSGG